MMYKCSSLVTAEAVISEAMSILNGDEGPTTVIPAEHYRNFRVLVDCYQNGREQGLKAWPCFKSRFAYYVCEQRHTDEITIYSGEYSMQGVSQDAYRHPNTFETTEQAAKWLAQELVDIYMAKLAKESQ